MPVFYFSLPRVLILSSWEFLLAELGLLLFDAFFALKVVKNLCKLLEVMK